MTAAAPDPHRTISILPGQIWCDRQIAGRRVLIVKVDPERVHYLSTYSAAADAFDVEREKLRTRGAPPSMKRSRWKSCFRFESHPDLSGGTGA
jgi:hypothetical protein